MINKYEYPPSHQMLNHSPLERNSHFFAKGKADFGDLKVDCEFEVAYSHNCEIIVILYLELKNYLSLYWEKSDSADSNDYQLGVGLIPHTKIEKISGRDLRLDLEIVVDEAFLLGSINQPLVYVANSVTITDFHINAIGEYHSPEFYLVGVDIDTRIMSHYEFEIGGNEKKIWYEPIAQDLQREYDNQAIAKLVIPTDCVPANWTVDDIADLWCALFSLATGRDVRWVNKTTHNRTSASTVWRRRSNVFGSRTIQGMIPDVYPGLRSENLTNFINRCFQTAFLGDIRPETIADYIRAIRYYIQYQMITRRGEDQARLITSLTEEVIQKWQRHKQKSTSTNEEESSEELCIDSFPQLQSEDETNALLDRAKVDVKRWVNEVIVSGRENTLKPSERRKHIKDRIIYYIKKELPRPSFGDKLKMLFAESKLSQIWFEKNVKHRITPFVKVRNCVLHTGEFPTKNIKKWNWYYNNMLMMLPLIVFALFEYEGPYIDLIKFWSEIVEDPSVDEGL